MLIRKLEDNTVVVISLGYTHEQEQQFIVINPTGNFSIVDTLPDSLYGKWKEVDGVIVADTDAENKFMQDNENDSNRAYLVETDWYITRNTETGEAIPVDILTKRQSAREAIV
jgi:hypothetical protein